ncbi:beta strand repeat-containing protein [Bergeyella zoohelcum]|uniref:Triple helix repeat-containing collagen n=2 Tax=Bergeyella zoohelcum TaxID=1015 RepID=A0A7Z9CG04_9FLAO|nr:hypothetical protein [Bergeyella zoohelcum]VDH04214.1 triple helix repeat-containing collagen [Bergeyella zoohelcum]
MKKQLCTLAVLASMFIGTEAFGQSEKGRVGVNTPTPKATLDIQNLSSNLTTNEGLLIPRLTKTRVASIDNNQLVKGTLVFVDNVSYSGNNPKVRQINEEGFYYYNGDIWTRSAGPAGANGKTILSGNSNPTNQGTDGDFYINTTTNTLFGPKTGSNWGSGKSLIGPKGANGNNGASMLTGNGVPQAATGTNGDSYVDTATGTVYKKNNGSWASIGSIKGATGQQGPQGVAGPKGANGNNGASMLTGNGVPQAATGANGDSYVDTATGTLYKKNNGSWASIGSIKGATGQQGPQGVAGPKGATGPQGPQGVAGPKGATGPQGVAGPKGANGNNGASMLTGNGVPQAATGANGDSYVDTATGTLYKKNNGSWASIGSIKGATGQQGPQGVAGPKGATGPQGVAGPKGANGNNGASMLTGNGVPQAATGANGDSYVDTATGTLYKKNNGSWASIGSIKGATGPQGPQGVAGPKGATGPQGVAGPKGANGNNGASMLTGNGVPQAATGANGDSYVDTATGTLYKKNNGSWASIGSIKGATGPQGPQGVAGPKGATGPQGPQGVAGPKGATGPQGVAGPKGANGNNGASMLTGNGVPQAATGANGDSYVDTATGTLYKKNNGSWASIGSIKGATGPQGPQGVAGPKGATGPQGVAGPKGANGNNGASMLTGNGVPQAATGANGDSYVDTATGTLYKKNNGSWASIGSIKGATGQQGPQGVAGPKGATGQQGPQGVAGPKGANGNNGASMLTGNGVPQAATGANGDSYVDTATGTLYKKNNGSWASIGSIKGATGQQGPQGVAGPKGATGPQGVAGPKGANGNNGASMLTGNGVPQAATGANGDSYVDTATGTLYKKNNGSWASIGSIKGATGQQGPQGVAGPKGATGPQGPQGVAGPKGANGNNGASMLTGNGVPQAATGTNGDSYVDTATGTLYKKNNGSWASIGSIKGATGPQGVAGPKGATGPQGPQGVAGPKGANGNNGASMLTGNGVPQAATGANGDSYVDTATGTLYKKNNGSWASIGSIKGATGQQGPQGVAGPKGATGPQGPQGVAGPKGANGNNGASMLTGNGVPQAATGTNGDSYVDTATGTLYKKNNGSWASIGSIKGATGQQGPQGVAGPKGATGPQGPAGPQGGIGLIGNGTNTTVTGNGTTANPYKINTSTGNITGTGITVGNGNGAALKNVTLSIADNAINSAKIQNGTVESIDIKDGTIVNADIANNTITGGKIANATITADKLAANVLKNIYNADGTLTGVRTLNTAGHTLTVEGTSASPLTVKSNSWYPLVVNSANTTGGGGVAIHPNDFTKRVELSTTVEGNFRLWANGNKLFVDRTTGNVGIGNDTPNAKLDVAGGARIIGDADHLLRLERKGSTDFTDIVKRPNGTFLITNNTGKQWKGGIAIDANGKVGLGTETPTSKLDVDGNARILGTLDIHGEARILGNDSRLLRLQRSGFTDFTDIAKSPDGTLLITNNTGNQWKGGISINAGGNVGIGTITPTAKLDVAGNVKSTALAGTGDRNVVASADGTLKIGAPSTPIREVTGATTITVTDNGGFVYVNATGAVNVTVPSTLPAGFSCVIIQQGTGQVRLVGQGVTLQSARGTKTRIKFSAVGIIKRTDANVTITGDAIN